MNEAMAKIEEAQGRLPAAGMGWLSRDVSYPRGSISQRNARLLRTYARFCGDALPEWIDIPVKIATPGSPTRRVRNPILEDLEEVFRSGTQREKAALRRAILADMPVRERMARRREAAKCR